MNGVDKMVKMSQIISRRNFLQVGLIGAGSALLAACASQSTSPPAAPTSAPTQSASAPSTAVPPVASKPANAGAAPTGSIVFMDGINAHSKLCYQWAQDFSSTT